MEAVNILLLNLGSECGKGDDRVGEMAKDERGGREGARRKEA